MVPKATPQSSITPTQLPKAKNSTAHAPPRALKAGAIAFSFPPYLLLRFVRASALALALIHDHNVQGAEGATLTLIP
jgi:hypothetical protein